MDKELFIFYFKYIKYSKGLCLNIISGGIKYAYAQYMAAGMLVVLIWVWRQGGSSWLPPRVDINKEKRCQRRKEAERGDRRTAKQMTS